MDRTLIVDCLLPGQVRRLGSKVTYISRRSAQRTSAMACEIRGGEYVSYDRADYRTALSVWKPLAEAGDATAQTYVGEIFEKGLGQPADPAQAAVWYAKAADAGSKPAMTALAGLYARGEGVGRDEAKAHALVAKAAGLEPRLIPAVEFSAPNPELIALRDRIADQDRTIARLMGEAAEGERRLAAQTVEIARLSAAAAAERTSLTQERANLAAAKAEAGRSADLAAREAALKARETQLAAREAAIQAEKTEAEALRKRVAELDAQLAAKTPPKPVVADGPPRIEILEPVINSTRGDQVVVAPAGARTRSIVGRITAPGGMKTLTVNGEGAAWDEAGMFVREVPVAVGGGAVEIVAIDARGRRSVVSFQVRPETVQGPGATPIATEAVVNPQSLKLGRMVALLIGNAAYQDPEIDDLITPVKDVTVLGEILRDRYGFEVTVLPNATRGQILDKLETLRAGLTETDNLLLYYAGHGELDLTNQRGHWLPVDASPDSRANWIKDIDLTDIFNTMSVKKLLVIADSCYSGSLTRDTMARLKAGQSAQARLAWLQRVAQMRSRTVLTSGGEVPVMDAGGDGHSVFAQALINVLRDNAAVLEGKNLHEKVRQAVFYAAQSAQFEQVPRYGALKYTNDEAGDFLFVPRV